MRTSRKIFAAIASAAALLTIGAAVAYQFLLGPSLVVQPLPSHPRVLSIGEVEQTLRSDLSVIYTVQNVPEAVQKDFTRLTGEPFDMSNPGEPISGDMLERNVPTLRLVFLALGHNREVLVYQKFGYINALIVVRSDPGGVWGARFKDYRIRTISGLDEAIRAGRYLPWGVWN